MPVKFKCSICGEFAFMYEEKVPLILDLYFNFSDKGYCKLCGHRININNIEEIK